jgi:probable rRNA maturation factor
MTQQYLIGVQVEGEWHVGVEALRQAAIAALAHQAAPSVDVAVVVSDDETLRELNRRYRGVDVLTDVLAFPNETRGPFVGAGGQPHYLGDIIISYPRAEEQAADAGHGVQEELQLLVVHGVLHLLGYDDQTEPERAQMWAVQEMILGSLDIQISPPD